MAVPTRTELERIRADRFGAAQTLTLGLGIVFLAAGIAGFAVTGIDDFFAHDTGEGLLWFGVNPAHNLLHLLFTGALFHHHNHGVGSPLLPCARCAIRSRCSVRISSIIRS